VKPSVIGTVSNLILNIFFVRKYGIVGAAFSTTISYTIYGVWTTLVYFKISKEYA
ncbi:MAG TPA: polysaccharide biosynthesis protein, partial [Clostridium sp.]|nr:polysaccharide biosynthesis protein [Clostridium sp.]